MSAQPWLSKSNNESGTMWQTWQTNPMFMLLSNKRDLHFIFYMSLRRWVSIKKNHSPAASTCHQVNSKVVLMQRLIMRKRRKSQTQNFIGDSSQFTWDWDMNSPSHWGINENLCKQFSNPQIFAWPFSCNGWNLLSVLTKHWCKHKFQI